MRKGLRIAMPCRPASRTCPYYLKAKNEHVGEERTKVLLPACCIQEGARSAWRRLIQLLDLLAFLSGKTLWVRLLSSTIVSPQTAFISSSLVSSRHVLQAIKRSRSKAREGIEMGVPASAKTLPADVFQLSFSPRVHPSRAWEYRGGKPPR